MERRLDDLERNASDPGHGAYVFRWSSQTPEEALAIADARRESDGLPPHDLSRPVIFVVFNDGKARAT